MDYSLSYSEILQTDLLNVAVFRRKLTEDGLLLEGKCPICEDPTKMFIPTSLQTVPTAGLLSAAQVSEFSKVWGCAALGYVKQRRVSELYEADLSCSCEGQHDPTKEKRGCGAWARVLVKPTLNGSNLRIDLDKPRTTPTTTDPKWDEKAQEASLEAVPKLRSTAEKWAASVGTLAGLFGTVALVSGPAKIADVDAGWRAPTILLVVTTVMLAALAVVLASLAAQGGSANIPATGPAFKELSGREVQRARNLLNASRCFAMIALVALVATFAVAAFNPKSEVTQPTVNVTYQEPGAPARTLCGILQQTDSGIKIRPGKGQADKSLPLSSVKTITPVGTCGS